MKTVLVSGCFDILHGGHVRFLRDARALGDYLVVCVANDRSLLQHKGRLSSMPIEHKVALLEALDCVDAVFISDDALVDGLDFLPALRAVTPDILAVAGDDKYGAAKCDIVRGTDCQYVVLRKALDFEPISTTEIRRRCAAPARVPLRVDFAGGWLDVPAFARGGGRIVNCAITPGLSLADNWLPPGAGLGGSAAWAMLNGEDPVESELAAGVGWQDPAVITETGLCVWRSGPLPVLERRDPGVFLTGSMALLWTGQTHNTAAIADKDRDLDGIAYAGTAAWEAVHDGSMKQLAHAVEYSHQIQIAEGMEELPACEGALAMKYCGSGWGGYALYLFNRKIDRDAFVDGQRGAEISTAIAIEPYDRWSGHESP